MNRSFHTQEGFPAPERSLVLPPNVSMSATHGSRELPPNTEENPYEISQEMKTELHQRDFSDFATGLVQEHFDQRGIVTPPRWGRLAGDPNRYPSATATGDTDRFRLQPDGYEHAGLTQNVKPGSEPFRDTTMGGRVPVWEKPPDEATRLLWIDENTKTHLEKLTATILARLEDTPDDMPYIHIDHHDTGFVRFLADGTPIDSPRLLQYDRDSFYPAVVSDLEGTAANPEITEIFIQKTIKALGEAGIILAEGDVDLNNYYKGGYTTRFVGHELPAMLRKWGEHKKADRINAIQLETPRIRTMSDETTQTLDPQKIAEEARLIHQIATETAREIA